MDHNDNKKAIAQDSAREQRLQALREEMVLLLREECLGLLRAEWQLGCNDTCYPGGIDALCDKYGKVIPSGVRAVLRYYRSLNIMRRKKALTLAGKTLKGETLSREEISWIAEVATPPKRKITESKEELPTWKKARHLVDSKPGRIKGNISEWGEKIYHLPGQKWYNFTAIDESQGERWFRTEEQAITAGWRKSHE